MTEIRLRDVDYTSLEATLAKGAQLLDPLCGIVSAVMPNPLENGDPFIHAYGTVAAQCSPLDEAPRINRQGGASLLRDGALAAAFGESVERYCSAYYERGELVLASYKEVAADAVHPSHFGLFSERQYQKPGFAYERFTTQTRVSWTWGYSLQQKRPVLVPAQMTYLPFQVDRSMGEPPITYTTSTGLACGNTIEEAILSGIGEVVERDAITCFWMNRLALPRVEVDAESAISEVFQEKFNLPGLRYYLCDATTDLDIPVFFTLLVGDSNYGRMVNAGSQASVSPTRAALKSFVEAAHGRPYVRYIVQQNPGWSYKSDFSNIVSFQDHAIFYTMAPQHFDELDFLIGPRPTKALSRVVDHSTGRALGDLDYCLSQLGRLGFDVIVVDLTTPDIHDLGFAVVRVIIPGLQLLHGVHHLPFLGNPRLYQLPVTLGYREQPLPEDGLNPYPHPLP